MTSFIMDGNESAHQEKLKLTNFCNKMFKVGWLVIMLKLYAIQIGKKNFNGITEWVDMTLQWQDALFEWLMKEPIYCKRF